MKGQAYTVKRAYVASRGEHHVIYDDRGEAKDIRSILPMAPGQRFKLNLDGQAEPVSGVANV